MASKSPLRLYHVRKNLLEMNSCYGDLHIGPCNVYYAKIIAPVIRMNFVSGCFHLYPQDPH